MKASLLLDPYSLEFPARAITAAACVLIFTLRWSLLKTLGACAVVGIHTQFGLLALG